MARLQAGASVRWDRAVAISPSQSRGSSPALAGGRTEATRLRLKGRHMGRGASFSLIKVLPLWRMRDWPLCLSSSFSLSRYTGGFRESKLINKNSCSSF